MEHPTIPLTPVTASSQITGIGYDSASSTLALRFKSAQEPVYEYAEVPPEVHEAMLKAESMGKYFGANVKGKFQFTKLPVPEIAKG